MLYKENATELYIQQKSFDFHLKFIWNIWNSY